jgi:iron complex outermembrane receptor protein/vitamin B12 transporter
MPLITLRSLLGSCLVTLAVDVVAAPVMEDVLVTGTFSPQPALTSSVSVLDAQQIEALNKTSVADLLKTLPGLLVEEQGGPGGLTAVSVRGGEANFTLVLVDGVEVNDPTNTRGGGFDFANLNPGLIDRIEVVRGAQSAIYGSDAVAGVINIITRRPAGAHQQTASAEWGEDDYADYSASALGRRGAFDYTLEVARRDDGEPVDGSERETDSANIRFGWRPTDAQEFGLGYRYLDGDRESYPEQSGGPELALNDDLDESDYTRQIFSLGWNVDMSPAWRSAVKASRFRAEEHFVSPGIEPYLEVPPNASDTDFTRDYVSWTNSLTPLPWVTVSLGADYRHEDGESDGYIEFFGNRNPTDFELDRDTTGVFSGITATPHEALLLQGSVRYDDPDEFDSETSWQAGARFTPVTDVILAANWGESYKLPSFFALGQALVGNPDLEPEQGESWDIGVAWQAVETLRLGATWFDNDYRDLVDFDDETFRNVNRSKVQTSGMELQLDWQPFADLTLRTQGTYTDIDVKNEDSRLTGRPQWVASAVVQWQVAADWLAALDYQYSGEQWAASRHTGEEVTEEIDDFHRVDWVLQWQVVEAWQLRLSLDNILDEDYETAVGFPAPGREFRLGVKFTN